MTNNENNDIDVDGDGDFDKNVPSKASLKETWENNPALKVAAVVLGGLILVGAYATFVGGEEETAKVVVAGGDETVKATPNTGAPDQVYEEALKKKNDAELAAAQQGGGSFIPQDIAGNKNEEGIQIPTLPPTDKANPLDEWRQRAEAKRLEMEETVVEEDASAQPEVVPLVQPVRPQAGAQQDPALGQRLAEQMRVIVAAQVPPRSVKSIITALPSPYAQKAEEDAKRKQQEAGQQNDPAAYGIGSGGVNAAAENDKVILPAGSIVYAQLVNELNSDVQGPALAQVLSGPFRGGRALGTFEKQDEYLTLSFNRVVKDGVVYSVNGVALDEETTLPAHQTEVDNHYFARVILPAAAAFIEGYASAVSETGQTTTTTSGGGVVQNNPEPDANEEVLKGVEEAASSVGEVLDENSNRPVTVIVAKGTTMGILFLDSVKTSNAE